MNLNHDVHSSPKEESYLNGSIDDFTDCIDFTKQYQKSCGVEESNLDDGLCELRLTEKKKKEEEEGKKKGKTSFVGIENKEEKGKEQKGKNDQHPMEPDVSITVGESNLDRTINEVATGVDSFTVRFSETPKKSFNKPKTVKKNNLKLPVNKNSPKIGLKNGKYAKRKTEQLGHYTNIKFKCYKCSFSDFGSISDLQSHQRKCITGTLDYPPFTPEPTTSPSSSNFRITRKVYLCSACGSYYENWNLFLHMKEIHNRHICLYCLGMFSQPDKLAQHLQTKHSVVEQTLASKEDFWKLYRGTCYLVCVTCEAMFAEQEDFFEHSCTSQMDDSSPCPLCGLQGAHFPTCRRAFSEPESEKSHPALGGKKLAQKKKKVKANKKTKDFFRIVNNEHNGEMSVIVRKQNPSESDGPSESRGKDHPEDMTSPLRNSSEDLKQYNEKMLQLFRPNKPPEKIISSIQSIEDSINRVVESSRISDDEEEKVKEEREVEEKQQEEPEQVEKPNPEPEPEPEPEKSPPVEQTQEPEVPNNEEAEEKEEKEEETTEPTETKETNEPKVANGTVPHQTSDAESTDSEKLTIAFDQPAEHPVEKEVENLLPKPDDSIPTASADTPYIHVSLKEETDNPKSLIKEFVKVSCWNCVYCSHSKRIAVNGKQLALHVLAEHRFVTVPEDATEEEKQVSAVKVINKLKSSLSILDNCYFNSDTFDSEDKEFWKPSDRIYECFHCLFATYVHKELYSHNRKMHQKAVFLCIMCKSNFYNYSELLCHLCPGIYISGQVINPDITYRCFLCNVDPLPSSFRLMVHLRRRHNSCDICFDQSANQFQLSTHVWKHKLSHMCYRCGIAYRNKPDITKHLFWKHGTESVLCKKCLQKKWPHVYHFCVPPNSFVCDECSVSLKSAVALKVHKRLHTGDAPYPCTKCEDRFISRKLLGKHLLKHEEEENKPPEPETLVTEPEKPPPMEESKTETEVSVSEDTEGKKPEKEKKSKKRKVLTDVFDLPPVNLSESDDSDQDEPELKPKVFKPDSPVDDSQVPNGFLNGEVQREETSPTQIVDGVWNNFQNYLVAKDMPKTFRPASPFKNMTLSRIKEIMLSDHDYHIIPSSTTTATPTTTTAASSSSTISTLDPNKTTEKTTEPNNKKVGLDHDYCNNIKQKASHKSKPKAKHREDMSKSSSSDSSSDSDSSCSCGSNCSCSSGSSSSTSSNDSDSDSRDRRKSKKNAKEGRVANEVETEVPTEVDISVHDVSNENLIRESDLDTDETETDEDFYDYNPAREANRILAEKRTQLLANLNGSDTVMSSPSIVAEKTSSPKKKTKLKKKRSQSRANNSRGSRRKNVPVVNKIPEMEPVLESTPKMEYETPAQEYSRLTLEDSIQSSSEKNTKRPKRKRVPLKFYGFSSEDENEPGAAPKKREKPEQSVPTPPSTTPVTESGDSTPTIWNPNSKSSLSWRVEKSDIATPKVNPIKIRTSQSTRQTPVVEMAEPFGMRRPERSFQVNGNTGVVGTTGQKGEKLYCFCQCPYDEVSEMIACDAEDCVIEWFHFECVGIMVPPKGSWYCPDCRKKLAAENEFLSPSANEPNVN